MENSPTIQSRPRSLLFVDDEPRVLDSIRRSLRGVDASWHITCVESVETALDCLQRRAIDVVISDVTMPGRDGFELIAAVASSEKWKHIPVLMLTGLADSELKRRALNAGASDLIAKPIAREDLIARIRSVLRTREYEESLQELNATLEQQVIQRTRDLEASRTDIMICLAMAGECRDTDTGRHLIRVSHYARLLARQIKFSPVEVELIFKTSSLHDIGKLGVADRILLKPGALDADERAAMQQHCEIGYRILSSPRTLAAAFDEIEGYPDRPRNPVLVAAAQIALSHHERWDGTGYPNRVAGEAIPIAARIVAVADVYDALTTGRPYKTAMTHETATAILHESSGSHFDPAIVEAFSGVQDKFNEIRVAWADSTDPVANVLASVRNLASPTRLSA